LLGDPLVGWRKEDSVKTANLSVRAGQGGALGQVGGKKKKAFFGRRRGGGVKGGQVIYIT